MGPTVAVTAAGGHRHTGAGDQGEPPVGDVDNRFEVNPIALSDRHHLEPENPPWVSR